jgi:undecaprenyl diphosphate synthase
MTILGRRDRIPEELRRAVTAAEHATKQGRTLDLRIALDYSSRDALVRAARKFSTEEDPNWETFRHLVGRVDHARGAAKDVDLLIRTGGEQRLSDFLLWECAYAELYFTRRMWPDFSAGDLTEAVAEFRARERRFGAVPAAAAG